MMMAKKSTKYSDWTGGSSWDWTDYDKQAKLLPPSSRAADKSGWGGSSVRCFHSHPPLPLRDGLVIYGGSCLTPVVDDADLYIGFDSGMLLTKRQYPWEPGMELRFRINDMQAPVDVDQFRKLIGYTVAALTQGQKVHAGCIGGHGRTGLFFAALVAVMMPEVEDAIGYVREQYCSKAVESKVQVDWLVKHFGVKKAAAVKSWTSSSASKGTGVKKGFQSIRDIEFVSPVSIEGSVWGDEEISY